MHDFAFARVIIMQYMGYRNLLPTISDIAALNSSPHCWQGSQWHPILVILGHTSWQFRKIPSLIRTLHVLTLGPKIRRQSSKETTSHCSRHENWEKERNTHLMNMFNSDGWTCKRSRKDPCLFLIKTRHFSYTSMINWTQHTSSGGLVART